MESPRPCRRNCSSFGSHRKLATVLLATTALTLVPVAEGHTEARVERLRDAESGMPPRLPGSGGGLAQAGPERTYDIPGGPLATALNRFADESGLQLVYDADIAQGIRTDGVRGAYSAEQALRLLLAGTGLEYRMTGGNTVTLGRAATEETPGRLRLSPITVEGAKGYAGQYEVDEGFKAEFQTSATKTPLPVRETPQSISIATRDSLEARQAQDLGQALETAAGVNQFSGTGPFGGKSPFGFDEVQIRGVALDGALDNREDGFVSPTFFSQPDLALYERVEVIKGPSSVLYGRGSAGGFVNRVRKKPLPKTQAEAKGEIGSFDHYRGEADVTGPLFSSDKARARLVAVYEDAGSFVDGVESERAVLGPSVELDLTESTRLLLQGTYQRDHFIPNPGFPLQRDGGGFKAPEISRSLFVGVPGGKNEWEVATGGAQLEQKIGNDWLATLKLTRSVQDSPVDVDSYAYGINANGDVGLYSSTFTFDTDVWAGEFKLDGSADLFGRKNDITVGVDHFKFEQARTDAFAALGTANIYTENFADFPTVHPTTISRSSVLGSKSSGVYGQAVLRPVERLRVLLGARYDWANSSYVDRLKDITSEKDDQAFTGRVGLSLDVHKNVSVYALYAESFSPDVFAVARGGRILDPETGITYEGGIKSEWLDGRLGITASVFRIERENVPISDPANGAGESFKVSGGLQRSDGVELEVNGEPLPGWQLSVAGTLMNAEFVEETDPFFGSQPAGTADWQIGMFTSYELQDGPLKGLGFGAGLFAIGERGISSFQAGGSLEGYERVDLTAFYNGFEPFKIALQVRNVLDEKYVEGADRTGAYAQFGSPTAVLMTVRARW